MGNSKDRSGRAVGAGELIDVTEYAGPDTEGEFFVPFWDAELYDEAGNPVGAEGPVFAENPWDRVQLGEYVLPGIWTATATPSLQLDVQNPNGFDGAAIITRGYRPAGITLTGQIWTVFQWRRMQEIFPAIWTRPDKIAAQDVVLQKKGSAGGGVDRGQIVGKQRSLTIVHPGLNFLGITALVIERLTPPERDSIRGVMKMTFQCIEYVAQPARARPATKKIQGQTSTRGGNAFDKAIEEKDARKPKPPSTTKAALEPEKITL